MKAVNSHRPYDPHGSFPLWINVWVTDVPAHSKYVSDEYRVLLSIRCCTNISFPFSLLVWLGDGGYADVDNTVEENSSVFSLI